jgi:hypothetical protein
MVRQLRFTEEELLEDQLLTAIHGEDYIPKGTDETHDFEDDDEEELVELLRIDEISMIQSKLESTISPSERIKLERQLNTLANGQEYEDNDWNDDSLSSDEDELEYDSAVEESDPESDDDPDADADDDEYF